MKYSSQFIMNSNKVKEIAFSYSTSIENMEEENRLLRETVSQLKQEIDKYKVPALMVADVVEVMKSNAIIKIPNGNRFFVSMANNVKHVRAGDSVLVEQKNLTIVERLFQTKNFDVEKFVILEKPETEWTDVGGLSCQINEIVEVIELPLKKPQLFKTIGIHPPKGLLLYGPPGTGKTLLAKAVANSTKSTFIEIVGSELVQKYIGEGAKLVREIFELAREKAPSIVFIDELDAIAAKRVEIGTSGEREVQRTFMQLLAELDGFKPLDNVKIIGCTNRIDILDPAILRPGRLDRLTEVPNPDKTGIREIFRIHIRNMKLSRINFEKICKKMDGFSGAVIKAVTTEAGYFAIRANRNIVTENDFLKAILKLRKKDECDKSYMRMFG